MIVVLLGTNPYSFDRLAIAVDELAGRRGWDVFMQTGHTRYQPLHCLHERFIAHDRLRSLVHDCSVLITQGGAGSIHEGLAANKPVIAVPRKPELGESQDRQEELVNALARQGRIIAVSDLARLETAIQLANDFRAAPQPANRIPTLIRNFIEALPA